MEDVMRCLVSARGGAMRFQATGLAPSYVIRCIAAYTSYPPLLQLHPRKRGIQLLVFGLVHFPELGATNLVSKQ